MTIAQASQKMNLSIDTLRYYERMGLLPAVRRSQSGMRDYGDSDLGWIEFIKCMRSAGIPIEVLAEYVALYQQGECTTEQRKELLVKERAKLVEKMQEMQNTLARLDYKIAMHEQSMKMVREPAAKQERLA